MKKLRINVKRSLWQFKEMYVKAQNKLKIGNIYDTIIDGNNGEYYIGRSYEMAPEIDVSYLHKKRKIIKFR